MKAVMLKFVLFLVAVQVVAGVQPEFDFFKLVVQWPHGFCRPNIGCLRKPIPDIFTIHGLWPSNFSMATLEKCSNTTFSDFPDPIYVASLDSKWMNLKIAKIQVGQPFHDQWFWRHEWEKHGTCSEKLYKQRPYFDLGVKLYDRFNITDIFQRNGITRGNYHPLPSLSTAILGEIGFHPDIRCVNGNVLLEVVICWDRLGTTPINCTQGPTCYRKSTGNVTTVLFP